MHTAVRYHILMDEVTSRVMIYDAETGRIQHPVCWQDISAYYHYLLGRGRVDEAQRLLAESMAGNKPITRLVCGMRQQSGEAGYIPPGKGYQVGLTSRRGNRATNGK